MLEARSSVAARLSSSEGASPGDSSSSLLLPIAKTAPRGPRPLLSLSSRPRRQMESGRGRSAIARLASSRMTREGPWAVKPGSA
jgi:hypothetical protein